jgi:hypothetical protein
MLDRLVLTPQWLDLAMQQAGALQAGNTVNEAGEGQQQEFARRSDTRARRRPRTRRIVVVEGMADARAVAAAVDALVSCSASQGAGAFVTFDDNRFPDMAV